MSSFVLLNSQTGLSLVWFSRYILSQRNSAASVLEGLTKDDKALILDLAGSVCLFVCWRTLFQYFSTLTDISHLPIFVAPYLMARWPEAQKPL